MLKLHRFEDITPIDRFAWFELAPGPDDNKFWATDSVYVSAGEWIDVGHPLIGSRLPGHARYERTNIGTEGWAVPLAYLADVIERLRTADEPNQIHVLLPELPYPLRCELVRGFPAAPDVLADELDELSRWVRTTLKRWKSITVIAF